MNIIDDDFQIIDNKRSEEIYRTFRQNFVDTDGDLDYMRRTIGALLVTDPINKDEPFKVERCAVPESAGFDGAEMKVKNFHIKPHDRMGGYYEVYFEAYTERNKYVYIFKGEIHQISPYLKVETAKFDINSNQ